MSGSAAAAAAAAASCGPDPKQPLFRELPPPPPFPLDALGPLRHAAEALQVVSQVPPALAAQSILGAATLVAQPHRDIELPASGVKPLINFLMTIAVSGERKTRADLLATVAVLAEEKRWAETYDDDMLAHRNEHEAWKAAREEVKRKGKGNKAAIKKALYDLGPEPKPPRHPMLLISDFTPQALTLHLRDGRPFCGVFSSEAGSLFGGYAFEPDRITGTGSFFNSLWDAAVFRRARVGTGKDFLLGRRCCCHAMGQPEAVNGFLASSTLAGLGTLARFLVSFPESRIGHRPYLEPPADCWEILDEYNDLLAVLLKRQPRMVSGSIEMLDPLMLTLSHDARQAWIRFHDATERDLASAKALHSIQAFGAKMAEHGGRLAAVLATIADPDTMEVDLPAMLCGIELARHYGKEMLRLVGGAEISPDLRLAERLLAWWQARSDPHCYLHAIYRLGPYAIREAVIAKRIVSILEEHGWIRRLPVGTVLDGSPRRDAWVLVP